MCVCVCVRALTGVCDKATGELIQILARFCNQTMKKCFFFVWLVGWSDIMMKWRKTSWNIRQDIDLSVNWNHAEWNSIRNTQLPGDQVVLVDLSLEKLCQKHHFAYFSMCQLQHEAFIWDCPGCEWQSQIREPEVFTCSLAALCLVQKPVWQKLAESYGLQYFLGRKKCWGTWEIMLNYMRNS